MTRRQLFLMTAGALAFPVRAWKPGKYGLVDVYRWHCYAARGIYLRVYYGGEDVTTRCRWADDTGVGQAELFLLDDGKKYLLPNGEIASETVDFIQMRPGANVDFIQMRSGAPS